MSRSAAGSSPSCMTTRKRTHSFGSSDKKRDKDPVEIFNRLEQQNVDNITIDFFYKSHTISLLFVISAALLYIAFTRNDSSLAANCYQGGITVCAIFLILSMMIMPNGPFVRPHPAVWRVVFGVSLLYFFALVFTLFLPLHTAREIMHYVYPDLKPLSVHHILDKEYAVNCSQVSVARVWSHFDVFAFGHFFGWMIKALLMRHYFFLWTLSINWEITEVAFCHVMPNFCECWWDSLFLDVLLCNGLGILVGMRTCRWLEMRDYDWEGIRHIPTISGKIKRAALQFTPRSWMPTHWTAPRHTHTHAHTQSQSEATSKMTKQDKHTHSSATHKHATAKAHGDTANTWRWMHNPTFERVLGLSILVIVWQLTELNAFFLKHIFIVTPGHVLTGYRLALISLISAPAIRQYYLYYTDPFVNRIGSQLWVFLGIVIAELIVSLKFGFELFSKTHMLNMFYWIVWLIFSSFATVFFCVR